MLKDLAEKEIVKKVNDNYDIDKKIKVYQKKFRRKRNFNK